jgi:hypothetical protein
MAVASATSWASAILPGTRRRGMPGYARAGYAPGLVSWCGLAAARAGAWCWGPLSAAPSLTVLVPRRGRFADYPVDGPQLLLSCTGLEGRRAPAAASIRPRRRPEPSLKPLPHGCVLAQAAVDIVPGSSAQRAWAYATAHQPMGAARHTSLKTVRHARSKAGGGLALEANGSPGGRSTN